MRSLRLTFVLCLLMVLLVPRPAHAWFEWLDTLSGPGPFLGAIFDFRVKCWGKSVGFDQLDQDISNAMFATTSVIAVNPRNLKADNSENKRQLDALMAARLAADADWKKVWSEFEVLQKRIGGIDQAKLTEVRNAVDDFKLSNSNLLEIPDVSAASLKAVAVKLRAVMDPIFTELVALASSGIFVSFCDHDSLRTFAFEVGLSTLQADSDPNFAHDYTIRLNMFTAGLSYRMPFDVVDIGARGGSYTFSSRGFDSFSGFLVQEFANVHAPSSWLNGNCFQQVATYFIFRGSLMWFTGGFDTAKQFAATGPGVEIISGAQPHFSGTVFFNLTPLLLRHVPPPPK